MNRRVAPLLFASGACALTYQVCWTRSLKLVFGSSTLASAAVLAIFMGGLGLGGAWLGRRAQAAKNPLRLYAHLELLVAASAAATPFLERAIGALYVSIGGSATLGDAGATVLRLVLSALVLGVPTVAMGGTLPAASRAVESEDDTARRSVAWLYGANTVGAVVGAALCTFLLLEALGTSQTLWVAAAVNLAIGVLARELSSGATVSTPATPSPAISASDVPRRLVFVAAAAVGFVFFLMELVWYRMFAPLLGGTTFTFGLILSLALAGVGLGGFVYARRGSRPVRGVDFAATAALEALAMAIPFALGDRLAILTILLRPMSVFGFGGMIAGWAVVAGVAVVPSAVIAGYQFPLLVGLLGQGERNVARDVGNAYAWNTVGAIAGALAGGFALLRWLGAVTCWRLVVALLAALALAALVRARREASKAVGVAALCALGVALLFARGPTAAWRHSAIGAGRAHLQEGASRNEIEEWARRQRRHLAWETDGLESSLAMTHEGDIAFWVNGKTDGSAVSDAPTQVWLGLIGAALHPHPQTALVVGLGTGSSAGWLGAVGEIQRVDVVEIEPAMVEVARACAAVNVNALENKKVHLTFGDAREALRVSRGQYDLILSEPSNPYRVGISNLYTREFYQAARARLAPGGIFLQWLQLYEVDGALVRGALATLASEFPNVDIWQTQAGDVVIAARMEPAALDASALRARLGTEPYRSALRYAWRTGGLEGFLAHFVSQDALARDALASQTALNTDDRPYFEFSFARSLGRFGLFDPSELRDRALSLGAGRPVISGEVDWKVVDEERLDALSTRGIPPGAPAELLPRARVLTYRMQGNVGRALQAWHEAPWEPHGVFELGVVAELLASGGEESALTYAEGLAQEAPVEANVVSAILAHQQGDRVGAATRVETALLQLRNNPWPHPRLMLRAFELLPTLAAELPQAGPHFVELLSQPFAAYAMDETRLLTRAQIAAGLTDAGVCAHAMHALEPDFPWNRALLAARARCYHLTGDPLEGVAARELAQFVHEEPAPFVRAAE